MINPYSLIDVHTTIINSVLLFFFSPEPCDDLARAAGERKRYFTNLFKSVPRRASHFEKNAFEVFSDGPRTKNYEVSKMYL